MGIRTKMLNVIFSRCFKRMIVKHLYSNIKYVLFCLQKKNYNL